MLKDAVARNAIRLCEIVLMPNMDDEVRNLTTENATFECSSPMYHNIKSIREAYQFSKIFSNSLPDIKTSVEKVFTRDSDVCIFMRYVSHFRNGQNYFELQPNNNEIRDYSFFLLTMEGDRVSRMIVSWDQLNFENQMRM